jgi:F-type H+-transporting ATPase subunit c
MKTAKRLLTSASVFVAVLLTSAVAFAEGAAGGAGGDRGWLAIGIGIGMGAAALGGALGQSRAAAAALEGISRNPNASDKVFVPMILGLAFIESLVLFTWVLLLLVQLKM